MLPRVLAGLADTALNDLNDDLFVLAFLPEKLHGLLELRVALFHVEGDLVAVVVVGHALDARDGARLAILLDLKIGDDEGVLEDLGHVDLGVTGAHVLVLFVLHQKVLADDVALHVA